MKKYSYEEAIVIAGGKIDVSKIPNWCDSNIIKKLSHEFSELSQWFDGFKKSVEIEFSNSVNFRCSVFPLNNGKFLCVIPFGLTLRLDYIIRFLEREANKESIQVVDPNYYGDLPKRLKEKRKDLPPPFPFDFLTKETYSDKSFWRNLKQINEIDKEHKMSEYPSIRIDQLRYSVLYCAFHEVCHVIRNHHKVLSAEEFVKSDLRGCELDADHKAGSWLALYRESELRSIYSTNDKNLIEAVLDSSWQLTYSFCLVFGLFDINELAIGDFDENSYHHPSSRLQMAVKGMFYGYQAYYHNDFIKRHLVPLSAFAAREYMDRANNYYINYKMKNKVGNLKRPTSLYFAPSDMPEMFPKDYPSMGNILKKAESTYSVFLEKYHKLLQASTKE